MMSVNTSAVSGLKKIPARKNTMSGELFLDEVFFCYYIVKFSSIILLGG